MYILQDGKLYLQTSDKGLVGVEIHPDKIITVEGTETMLGDTYRLLSYHEVMTKYQIFNGKSYIFPQKPKPVIELKVPVEEETDGNTTGYTKRPYTRRAK